MKKTKTQEKFLQAQLSKSELDKIEKIQDELTAEAERQDQKLKEMADYFKIPFWEEVTFTDMLVAVMEKMKELEECITKPKSN
jgi:hypothetical protein